MKPAFSESGSATLAPVDTLVAWSIGLAAAAGGLIHVEATVDHRHLAVVAMGFAAMAASQTLFAGMMFFRASRSCLAWGAALHTGILLVWILSRTLGLPFIPGAERPSPVGVADLVANTLSTAVASTSVVALSTDRSGHTAGLRPRVIRTIKAVVLAGVLILTVPALADVNDHDHHEDVVSQPATGHDDSNTGPSTTHADHSHGP